mgnify:CR=1 FL=1
MWSVTPTVEQCARWAEPNASITNTSASEASSDENGSRFFVSSFLKLSALEKNNIVRLSFLPTAFLAFSPTTSSSLAKTTSWPRSSESLTATGASENFSSGPFFGLPRCEQRITLPPSAISFLIVGRAAVILLSFVDYAVLERYIEVTTNKYFFTFYIDVINRYFVELHNIHSFRVRRNL